MNFPIKAKQKIRENFSRNLTKFLTLKNLKQKDLADFLNVHPVTVSNWINQKSLPSLEKLKQTAIFLDVTEEDLTFFEEKISTQNLNSKDIILREILRRVDDGDTKLFLLLKEISLADEGTLDELQLFLYQKQYEKYEKLTNHSKKQKGI